MMYDPTIIHTYMTYIHKNSFPAHGTIIRLNEAVMDKLIAANSTIEILFEDEPLGTTIYEGPVWRSTEDGG